MTPEFTHCALHVRDLDRSIAFYESYCGLRIVKEHGQGRERTVWMASADDRAEFVLVLLGGGPKHAQDKNDMTHYGFAVSSRADVEAIAERGRGEGRRSGNRRSSRHPPVISARSRTRADTSLNFLMANRSAKSANRDSSCRRRCGVLALESKGLPRVNPRDGGNDLAARRIEHATLAASGSV